MKKRILQRNKISISFFLFLIAFFLPLWHFSVEHGKYQKMNLTTATISAVTTLGESSELLAYTLSFQDTRNNLLRLTCPPPKFSGSLHINDHVEVLYDPFMPSDSYIKHPLTVYPRTISSLFLSLIPFCAALFVLIKVKRK